MGASSSLRSSMVSGIQGMEQAAHRDQHGHAQYKDEAAGDRVRRTRVQRGQEAGGRHSQRIGDDGDRYDHRQKGKPHPGFRIGHDSAEFGADGKTHAEVIEDWRESFSAWIRDRRAWTEPERFIAAVEAHFDAVEAWHES